eukprot:3818071-Ditylum_brightwellii.AAC.1
MVQWEGTEQVLDVWPEEKSMELADASQSAGKGQGQQIIPLLPVIELVLSWFIPRTGTINRR